VELCLDSIPASARHTEGRTIPLVYTRYNKIPWAYGEKPRKEIEALVEWGKRRKQHD